MSPLLFLLLLDLRGRVVDAQSGQPVRKAEVHLTGQGRPVLHTDAEGRFVFEKVPAGLHAVYVRARGHATSRLRAGKGDTPLRWLWLDEKTAQGEFVAHLHRGARVEGRLVDPDGDPLARQEVFLLEEERGQWQFAAVVPSQDDGSYSFYGIAPGRYAVAVMGALEDLGTLRYGEERSGLELRLPAPSRYRVELRTSGYGRMVENATLQPRGAPALPPELAPQLETYPLRDQVLGPKVPAGEYTLRLFTAGPGFKRLLLEQNLSVREDAEAVPLAPSRYPDLALRASGFQAGSHLRLESIEPGNESFWEVSTDESGAVIFEGVSRGRYRWEAKDPRGAPLEVAPAEIDFQGAPVELLSKGPRRKVVVEMPKSEAKLYSVAVGRALTGALIEAPVGRDGRATLYLPEGSGGVEFAEDLLALPRP